MSKELNDIALRAIIDGSEVSESGAIADTQPKVVLRQPRKRVEHRNFSVNFRLDDYNKFQQYLNDNNIGSGSEFIRELLREKGVI
ncbi:hypothetical protein KDE13_09095 [Campylobacter sp. faydin G-140]|uniref:hypothetical protein n=1 Tax=Campylobacter anatolicus TaxID=2829105 RepID=UPI001BA2DD40|nr:hypothetical protein [Campylobacter anatolicus]MBR8466489.1 hypothetical protein [Campylobacter anatolicus]